MGLKAKDGDKVIEAALRKGRRVYVNGKVLANPYMREKPASKKGLYLWLFVAAIIMVIFIYSRSF